MTTWLLDVTIDGVPYRWSVTRVEVDGVVYETGLADLALPRGADSADVSVTDPGVDWPALAGEFEGGLATIRRWDGTDAAPEVFVRGEVHSVQYGLREDPALFTIESLSGSGLGYQIPDPLARVDGTTWPRGSSVLGDEGRAYPLVLGYPGYISSGTVVPVVPVPLAQWDPDDADTLGIVADDVAAQITSVLLRNQTTGIEADEDVSISTDLLGRSVRVADFSADPGPKPSGAVTPASVEAHDLYAGYSPTGGGGLARDGYSVALYVLRRGRATDVDFARFPDLRDQLGSYFIDTWIDDPVPDPWAWLESALLPDLPFEIRTGSAGRYLVERRYVSDPRRRVGAINVDDGDAAIASAISFDTNGPINEFTAFFRANREGDWLGQIVMTGSEGVLSAPAISDPSPGTSQRVVHARNGLCSASVARFGLRQSPGGPITIDWTWDEGTVLRVLGWRAQRDALPARLVEYQVEDGADLNEGDELDLTDTARGLTGVAAIVDGPPVVGSAATTVPFRIPRSS